MSDVVTMLPFMHHTSYVGLLSCYWLLWTSRRDYEAPYRPLANRAPLSLVWGVWGRRVCLYTYCLTGICYLHLNQLLLSDVTIRVRIGLSIVLLVVDQLYVAAMRPKRPHAKPTGSRTTKALSILSITLFFIMWV